MALRDIGWITDSHAIVTRYEITEETLNFLINLSYTRSRTIIDEEWVCLTYAAAKAYADTHAGDTNRNHEVIEQNRIVGSWKLVRHTDSAGAWT